MAERFRHWIDGELPALAVMSLLAEPIPHFLRSAHGPARTAATTQPLVE